MRTEDKIRYRFTYTRTGEPCVVVNGITYSKLFLEVEVQNAEANGAFDYSHYLSELIRFLPEPRVLN